MNPIIDRIIKPSDNKEKCSKCGSTEKFEFARVNIECKFMCLGCRGLFSFNPLTNVKRFIGYVDIKENSLGDLKDCIIEYLEDRFKGETD